MTRRSRFNRGVAMPLVLGGMAVAILIVALAWSRSWTRRSVSTHQSIQWQARLLAESGTACALQEAMERMASGGPKVPDSSRRDTSKAKKAVRVMDDSASEECVFHTPVRGAMTWNSPIGTQILMVESRGELTESGNPVAVGMRSAWGGAPPADTFRCAVNSWNPQPPQILGKVVGCVRTRAAPLPPGMVTLANNFGIFAFKPTGFEADTAAALGRMLAAFRSEAAKLGGDRFSQASPPPAGDSLVFTLGDVVFDGPWTGEPWSLSGGKDLFVEGRVEFRGQIRLAGWRIWATGQVVVQDQAHLEGVQIYSRAGVRIADHGWLSGQILSSGGILLSGTATLGSPTFAAVWPGKGADSLPRIFLEDRSRATAYLFADGGAAEIRIGRNAMLEGVAVSGGILRNDGVVHGLVAVASRLDCGQPGQNCSNGSFLRDRLPPDFAFPLGLPGNKGVRLLNWSLDR